MKSNYFKGKTVWITGASSGIGEGLAKRMSELGAFLILSARREDKLKEVQASLAYPEKSFIVPFDVEVSSSEIDTACRSVLESYNLDIVVLNAGISQRASVLETSFATEAKIMNTNYHGLVRIAKTTLRPMLDRGQGHFVIMSSVVGKIGIPDRSTYAASKHALHGYFDSLRAEVEDLGVSVTVICPGYVHTNISSNAVKGDGKSQDKIDENSKNGMSVERFCEKAISGIARRKTEMLIGGKETFGVLLKRFFPSILFHIAKGVKPK